MTTRCPRVPAACGGSPVAARSSRLLLFALVCLTMAGSISCANFIVGALGTGTSASPEAVQFGSMARYAVDEINARWSVDTLTLDFAGTASSPAQIVSYYLSAAATSDVLAVLGTGDESLDSALSLVSAHAAVRSAPL